MNARAHHQMLLQQGASFKYFDPAHNNLILSNGNQTAGGQPLTLAWNSVLSVTSHNSGQRYAQFNDDVDTPTWMVTGVGTALTNLSSFSGANNESWGIHCNKPNPIDTYHGGVATSGGNGSITDPTGRSIVAVDFSLGFIWLGTNALPGIYCGGGDPALGTSPTYTFTPGITLYLVASIFSQSQVLSLENNPGENTLPLPTGFTPWG